jgi:hypothetical protein
MRFHTLNRFIAGCLRLPYKASTVTPSGYVIHSIMSLLALVWGVCGLVLSGEVLLLEAIELISGQVIEREPITGWLSRALFSQSGLSSFLALIFVFMAPIMVGAAVVSLLITLLRYLIIAGIGVFLLILAMPVIILCAALIAFFYSNTDIVRILNRLSNAYIADQYRQWLKEMKKPVS